MNRFTKTILGAGLFTLATFTTAVFADNVNVSNTERAKIESVVADYLMKKPEVIIQAVQSYQQKQYQQAEQTIQQTQKNIASFADPLFHQPGDPVIGNPNGKITVVEFFDYQCPHCVDMAPVIAGIIKNNKEVRVIFKEFPIRGPASDYAARAALAANKQGKYYEFSHTLLTLNQQLTPALILDTAKKTGVNVDQLKKDMDSAEIKKQLQDNMKLGQGLKLFGTPALFVGQTNGKGSDIHYVPGQMNQQQLQEMIDKAS